DCPSSRYTRARFVVEMSRMVTASVEAGVAIIIVREQMAVPAVVFVAGGAAVLVHARATACLPALSVKVTADEAVAVVVVPLVGTRVTLIDTVVASARTGAARMKRASVHSMKSESFRMFCLLTASC